MVGAKFYRTIEPGEVVVVNNESYREKYTEETTMSIDSMEYIYFACPDSNIAGVNVHTARKNMRRMLTKEESAQADVVVGVPIHPYQPKVVMRNKGVFLMKWD